MEGNRRYNGAMGQAVRPAILLPICAIGGMAIGLAWNYRVDRMSLLQDNRNFVVIAPNPSGWLPLRPGPMTVSMYQHPLTGVTMRCARNESVAATCTEPDIDSAALANQFINLTRERLKGWTANAGPAIVGSTWTAPVTDRTGLDRRVVTAYIVQGNSTYIFTLCGIGRAKEKVEGHVVQFREWVARARLEQVLR